MEHDEERRPSRVEQLVKRDRKHSLYTAVNQEELKIPEIPDFVLVYQRNEKEKDQTLRNQFQENLEAKGLYLEKDCPLDIDDVYRQTFVYATPEVLFEYADILKLRMPIKKKFQDEIQTPKDNPSLLKQILHCSTVCTKFLLRLEVDQKRFPKRDNLLTAEYSSNREFLFDVENEDFFTQSDRILIVNYILQLETCNTEDETNCVGIKQLLNDKVFSAVYPLHDEQAKKDLIDEWAGFKNFTKNQPIDYIKDYFGVKTALYFAWLGFYTDMLIPVSILGVLCIAYGVITIPVDELSTAICYSNITMCPQCDQCDYWNITDACFYAEITHTFDNIVTLGFAVAMSLWSAIYLTCWKRISSELVHRWGLSNFFSETYYPRPEYLAKLKNIETKKKNKHKEIKTKQCKVTQKTEPVVPLMKKIPIRIASAGFSFFWIAVLLCIMTGIIVFRISSITSEEIFDHAESSNEFKTIGIPATAALFDLIVILILNHYYEKVAVWLTEKEYHRTQIEFDDSLTLKIYTFQFINYYSGFFYIAFLKGRIVGHPKEYKRFLGKRLEECSPGGCLMELCIQLVIVMIGDQAWGSFTEYVVPKFQNWKKGRKISKDNDAQSIDEENPKELERPLSRSGKIFNNKDHKLLEWEVRGLFDEYLEMVVQYGFVTLFVTAFPLAPLCALINNIIEIRGDAKKFLTNYRRPVAETVKDIGVWLRIIDIIGKLAIVSNGFIIAFTSNFIPRLVHHFSWDSEEYDSYLLWSLSSFNTTEFENNTAPLNPSMNASVCYYPDFRWPHDHANKYLKSKRFWHVLAARLIFVLVYQHIIVILKLIIKYFVPETPKRLKTKIMKEQWNLCKIITKHQQQLKKAASKDNLASPSGKGWFKSKSAK